MGRKTNVLNRKSARATSRKKKALAKFDKHISDWPGVEAQKRRLGIEYLDGDS